MFELMSVGPGSLGLLAKQYTDTSILSTVSDTLRTNSVGIKEYVDTCFLEQSQGKVLQGDLHMQRLGQDAG